MPPIRLLDAARSVVASTEGIGLIGVGQERDGGRLSARARVWAGGRKWHALARVPTHCSLYFCSPPYTELLFARYVPWNAFHCVPGRSLGL
jgi:hypothetical protein